MANTNSNSTYSSAIDEMMSELNDLKESPTECVVSSLSKSDVNVLSTHFDKIVIEINLNQNNESKDLFSDKNTENGSDSNDSEEPKDDCNESTDQSNASLEGQSHTIQSQSSEGKPSNATEQKQNQLQNFRTFRRTYSESNKEAMTRGILKYPQNWSRRTVSESSCDFANSDFDHYSDIFSSIDEIYSEDELYSENKPKKNVRFSEHVSKTVFRATSSILGRKLKNKKRSKNRKNSKKSSDFPECQTNSSKTPESVENQTESQRSRQDSGYDSEDVGHEDIKLENHLSNKSHKQNNSTEIETGINSQSYE